jgi:hypothetical protein
LETLRITGDDMFLKLAHSEAPLQEHPTEDIGNLSLKPQEEQNDTTVHSRRGQSVPQFMAFAEWAKVAMYIALWSSNEHDIAALGPKSTPGAFR